jgi:cell division protein FtsI/penicillin-binding protein 2
LAKRGNIYLTDYSQSSKVLAAANKTINILYSNNKQLSSDISSIAEKLSGIVPIDKAKIELKLSETGKSYQVISRDVTSQEADNIKKLNIRGITVASQIERTYPMDDLVSHILGFVGFSGEERAGQYGVEAFYNTTLGGGEIQGKDLILTIDLNIQETIAAKLSETLKKLDSPSGTIIVQEPKTGNILAMVSSPSFDPNNYWASDYITYINPAVQEVYEPGSSFKPVTMAGAIDQGVITPETTYTDSGQVVIADRTIKNFDEKAHGVKTMREVLQMSLNTGVVFVEDKMGDDTFLNNVVAFGFGSKTGIDLSGEVGGNISQLFNNRKINFATASFGQGIAVTPIQLINAYSVIANGGKLMKPNIVSKIIDGDSSEKIEPKIIGAPINEKTAKTIQSMLTDVVDKGFDKARIKGYDIAGKTGTAQIPDESGGYMGQDRFIHNFVGFAPSYNARFVVLIKVDQPKGIKFAADSLSPVFGDIAKYLIRYFNIPPTR